jgi:hypothetical protein
MSVGSVVNVPSLGRLATVVGTTAVGVPEEGRQHVQVRYTARVPDTAAGGGSEGSRAPAPPAEAVRAFRTVRAAGDCSDCRDDGDRTHRDRKDALTAAERAALDRLRQMPPYARRKRRTLPLPAPLRGRSATATGPGRTGGNTRHREK